MTPKYNYKSKLKNILYKLDKRHIDANKAIDLMISVQNRAQNEYPDAIKEINDVTGDYLEEIAKIHNQH